MNINIYFKPLLYLDPGTGSFIIQILLAGLLGLGVAVKVYWNKIVKFFNRNENDTLDALDEIDEYRDQSNSKENDDTLK
jgi:hypothetical protein